MLSVVEIQPWPNGVASYRNFNRKSQLAHTDLRWVAKRNSKQMQVARKPFQYSLVRALILLKTILRPTCAGWPNGEKLALTCALIYKVIASARK